MEVKTAAAPATTLNNGITMPLLGFGTWQLKGKQAEQAVTWALKAGYRHIDTAAIYGNEREVGRAIRNSGVPRKEIFLTTKLWPASFMHAERAYRESLKRLGLDYADLYLIHWPVWGKGHAWKSLANLYRQKLVRSIGVSNYSIDHLRELLKKSPVVPVTDQVEFSPFKYEQGLLEFCQEHGIALTAYSPLTRGKKLREQTLAELAQKYRKTPAQVILRWCIQLGVATIPKATSKQHIEENFNIFNFELSQDDMDILNSLDENYHAMF